MHHSTVDSAYIPANRPCLICSGFTKCSHMGIDACRACATFYRRAKERNAPLVCRSGTGRCALHRDEGFSCKRCRYERFSQVLEAAHSDDHKALSDERPISLTPSVSMNESLRQLLRTSTLEATAIIKDEIDDDAPPAPAKQARRDDITQSPIPKCAPIPSLPAALSLEKKSVNRIKQSYSLLCLVRRTSELSSRSTPINPLQASNGDIPFARATFASLNQSTRILLTALFDFASSAFSDFDALDSSQKWMLVRKFTQFLAVFESFFRARQLFPNNNDVCMIGYTSYLDLKDAKSFSAGSSSPAAQLANELVSSFLAKESAALHGLLARVDPSEDEFIALLGLAFWNTEWSLDECLIQLAVRNQKAILHDLHLLYKDEKHAGEYAVRLGEILLLLMNFKTILARMPQRCEYLHLLDDDCLLSQQQ